MIEHFSIIITVICALFAFAKDVIVIYEPWTPNFRQTALKALIFVGLLAVTLLAFEYSPFPYLSTYFSCVQFMCMFFYDEIRSHFTSVWKCLLFIVLYLYFLFPIYVAARLLGWSKDYFSMNENNNRFDRRQNKS